MWHCRLVWELDGSWAKVGSTIPGRLYDIRNKLVSFDGKQPHMVMPFQGSRISIVYFTSRHCAIYGRGILREKLVRLVKLMRDICLSCPCYLSSSNDHNRGSSGLKHKLSQKLYRFPEDADYWSLPRSLISCSCVVLAQNGSLCLK